MEQIKNLFFYVFDAMHHKRVLGVKGPLTGGKSVLEFSLKNNEEGRSGLLRMCIISKQLGVTNKEWTDAELRIIQDLKDVNKYLEFFIVNGFDFSWKGSAISSVTKIFQIKGNWLRLRIYLDQSNPSRFEFSGFSSKECPEPALKWDTFDNNTRIPQWDDIKFGGITDPIGAPPKTATSKSKKHKKYRDNWKKQMKEEKFGFYLAQLDYEAESFDFGFFNADSIKSLPEPIQEKITNVTDEIEWSSSGQKKSGFIECLKFTPDSQSNETLKEVADVINNNKTPNILLYGPPGTGKTYLCQSIRSAIQNKSEIFIEDGIFTTGKENAKTWWVTFHQGVTYEDFVLGLRPQVGKKGGMELVPRAGPLLEAMLYAKKNGGRNHSVVFIDEINRGDLSRIFGDFITYMDMDKRGIVGDEKVIVHPKYTLPLTFSALNLKEKDSNRSEPIMLKGIIEEGGIELEDGGFIVPPNLTIIATMNSLDRSVAPMDSAMKRRFYQINISPDVKLIERVLSKKGVKDVTIYVSQMLMAQLNTWLEKLFNDDIQIGPSYFLSVKNIVDLQNVWERRILPLLLELCRGTSKRRSLKELIEKNKGDKQEKFDEKFKDQGLETIEKTGWPYSGKGSIKPGLLSQKKYSEEKLYYFFSKICEDAGVE